MKRLTVWMVGLAIAVAVVTSPSLPAPLGTKNSVAGPARTGAERNGDPGIGNRGGQRGGGGTGGEPFAGRLSPMR